MGIFVDRPSKAPYINDDTRSWVEQHRVNGLVKPQCLLRFATDTNYIHNATGRVLYNGQVVPGGEHSKHSNTKSIMNLALPGMRMPGVLNWSVTEQLDNVVQTATFEALNALPISETSTQLEEDLAGVIYGKSNRADDITIWGTWAQDSLGATYQVTGPGGQGRSYSGALPDHTNTGNNNIELYFDKQGYRYLEHNVKYRIFQNQVIRVGDLTNFPDPRIPNDDDNDVSEDENWPDSDTGQGSYFVLIGNEVIRVVGYGNPDGSIASGVTQYLLIPPGGRAVNGIIEEHHAGDEVHLLGYGPYTGDWCAMGYLNLDEYAPQTSILRPGTCLVSYEGYGDFEGEDYTDADGTHRHGLRHDYEDQRNYQFTGYWFITGVEPSLADDGVPKVKVDLKGTGFMFDKQKITPDLIRRVKNQFDQWHIAEKYGEAHGKTIWGAAGHSRRIPGDWAGYNSWDPSLIGSYPLKIQTELAQHKAFFDHMKQTQFGTHCLICRQEAAEWEKSHVKDKQNSWQENRALGKHIYKESIRVETPITTFVRLMATLAAAAWDHPAMNTDLAQKFTKLPNKLFDNIRNIHTGLVFNGQLVYDTKVGGDSKFDWSDFTMSYDDQKVHGYIDKMISPFEGTYDQAPFWQPMQDLADLNGCILTVSRQGYPVFVPRLFSTRPAGTGFKTLATKGPNAAPMPQDRPSTGGEIPLSWHLSYGGSISGYSPSINIDGIITQYWITAQTAFDGSSIQVSTGGTGFKGSTRVFYSGLDGNKEGLMFTSGVQQVEQGEISNLVLGLDWDTMNASRTTGWGARFVDEQGDTAVKVGPPFYEGADSISKHTKGHTAAKTQIQRTINFFIQRQLIPPYELSNGNWVVTGVNANGKFGEAEEKGVEKLQHLVNLPTVDGAPGVYTQMLTLFLQNWLNEHEQFVKFDPMWYVKQPYGWSAYVSAITGAPLVVNTKSNITPQQSDDYIPDNKATNTAVANWAKTFAKSAINIGARRVDESIDKATARSITTNLADPRVICGDVIWAEVPGFIEAANPRNELKPPFKNGIYVTQINRQMDLQAGTYTGSYSGYRYRADFQKNINQGSIKKGWLVDI